MEFAPFGCGVVALMGVGFTKWDLRLCLQKQGRKFRKTFSLMKKIKHFNFMESLILAQSERWRRA